MSSEDVSSEDASRRNGEPNTSEDNDSDIEHQAQQSNYLKSDNAQRKDSSSEISSLSSSERHQQRAPANVDDDESDALLGQNTADSNSTSSRRQPVLAVSDDSDAVSEREPEKEDSDASEKVDTAGSRSISEADGSERGQRLKDIELSGSDSDKESDEEEKELTEDDIVGPRLYPDPGTYAGDTEHLEPTIVEVSTARICPKFTDQGLYFVKFPNFMSIEPRPFDHEHYEDEFDEDDLLDEEGRARLKLRVENTIRWRYVLDDDGNIQKQGNAKFVRWSDGTMSLYLGAEIFDVTVQPMQLDNHLFLRQGAGLQGHAVFREKLVFRPHSTDSITHRKVTLSMADRSNKSQKVKVLTAVGLNPESKKAEIVRKEEERMRAQNRREAQQRRNRMRPSLGRSGLTANFLEDRDEESEEESVSAIKSRYKHGLDDRPLIGHSDSEDSDSKRLHDIKKDSEDSDSDQERRKQKKKKVIIEDDDDEDN